MVVMDIRLDCLLLIKSILYVQEEKLFFFHSIIPRPCNEDL